MKTATDDARRISYDAKSRIFAHGGCAEFSPLWSISPIMARNGNTNPRALHASNEHVLPNQAASVTSISIPTLRKVARKAPDVRSACDISLAEETRYNALQLEPEHSVFQSFPAVHGSKTLQKGIVALRIRRHRRDRWHFKEHMRPIRIAKEKEENGRLLLFGQN